MNMKNFVGVGLCSVIFATSILFGDDAGLLFNVVGILVVVSGTFGATFLSYPFEEIRAAFRVAKNTYAKKTPAADNIVKTLLDVSVKSRHDGLLSLEGVEEEMDVMFLQDALGMIVDGFREEEICDVLLTESYFFKQRRRNLERIFRHMASLAPAFGITGSVVGLIGMLTGMNDTGVILHTIPIALTSTLYGIVLSNFLFTPVAESIYSKTQRELLMQKLVIDGIASISREHNSHKLQKKLESFLMPSQRPANKKSFEEIKEKYRQLRLDKVGAGNPLQGRVHTDSGLAGSY